MLYVLFDWLEMNFQLPGAQVFQFLSFRATVAALLSLFISWFVGKRIIRFLRGRLLGETIRELGPKTHKKKAGTPTMGGLIILTAILVPTLLMADITSGYVWLICLATAWMGAIGFIDDYIKVVKKNKSGLAGKFKIFGQVGLGLIVGLTMVLHPDFTGRNPHVDSLGYVKPNNLLQEKGFKRGDQIISINGVQLDEARDTWISSNYSELPEQPLAARELPVQFVNNGKDDSPRKKLSHSIADFELVRSVQQDGRVLQKQFVLRVDRDVTGVLNALFGKPIDDFMYTTNLPFVKTHRINYANLSPGFLGEWGPRLIYILLAIFIVTAVSNGTNITDGLDGLAGGTSAIVGVAFGLFAYLSGNKIFADYLNIEFIPRSGELLIFSAAFVGACIGFLWYNAYPAMVFMGDTGSLALGAAVAVLSLMIKKELLLPIVCGVFFVESLSVILQVSYFKYTKRRTGEGRRIFRMAPLHHHYELQGWHEAKVVARFWIVSVLLVLFAFVTLKLR
ncbi:MAG: phospho-N-acetylmuramoyl-pentapeptide-transferase [Bacteroidota bacterium]